MLGAVSVTRKLPLVWRENLALIGEASGSVDAITGEGLTVAFQQALALAEALAAGDLQLYQAAHRRIVEAAALHDQAHAEHGPACEFPAACVSRLFRRTQLIRPIARHPCRRRVSILLRSARNGFARMAPAYRVSRSHKTLERI